MQIILLENVDKIGRRGEIVSVSKGYARNYLIPSGLATYVTADNLRRAELLKKKYIQEEMERLGALKEMAAKLGTVSVTIHAKASEEGNLFGSVGPNQILDALKEQGFELELKTIKLEENIKRVGVYSVPVQLHSDIQADVKLWVVEEKVEEEESREKEA
jgi:large subunit ribosomal protein L9